MRSIECDPAKFRLTTALSFNLMPMFVSRNSQWCLAQKKKVRWKMGEMLIYTVSIYTETGLTLCGLLSYGNGAYITFEIDVIL